MYLDLLVVAIIRLRAEVLRPTQEGEGVSAVVVLQGVGEMRAGRWIRHIFGQFSPALRRMRSELGDIEQAISVSESQHTGQICFAIEPGLTVSELWKGVASRQRAEQVFSHLGVWNTEHNNGVLIYLLLADRKIEIVADRGIARMVTPEQWTEICHLIEAQCRKGKIAAGIVQGVEQVGSYLHEFFPGAPSSADSLSNRPVIV